MRKKFFGCLILSVWLGAPTSWAQSSVTVAIDAKAASTGISPLFSGLSFETQMALPNADGQYYFRPSNKPLVTLFRTLGIKNLRVGGNTADRDTVNIPNDADLDSLFAFAEAAGVKVIYTLRLNNGDPKQAGQIARYIMQHYKSDLVCLAIGNEPNVFRSSIRFIARNGKITWRQSPRRTPRWKQNFAGRARRRERRRGREILSKISDIRARW
jgi:hypothetical protein